VPDRLPVGEDRHGLASFFLHFLHFIEHDDERTYIYQDVVMRQHHPPPTGTVLEQVSGMSRDYF
jgi:hypothetical protein